MYSAGPDLQLNFLFKVGSIHATGSCLTRMHVLVGNLNCFCFFFWQNNKKGSAAQKKTTRTISSKVAETHCTTHPPPLPPPTPPRTPPADPTTMAECQLQLQLRMVENRAGLHGAVTGLLKQQSSTIVDQEVVKAVGHPTGIIRTFVINCASNEVAAAHVAALPALAGVEVLESSVCRASSSWCVAGGQGSANQTRPTHGRIPHCPFRLACCCNPCREELAPCPNAVQTHGTRHKAVQTTSCWLRRRSHRV